MARVCILRLWENKNSHYPKVPNEIEESIVLKQFVNNYVYCKAYKICT